MARKMEQEALLRELYNQIRRYPLRNVTRPNYCELSDLEDDSQPEKIRSRRRSVSSVFIPGKGTDHNNIDRKRIIRRRYSESVAVTLKRQEDLLADTDFYVPQHEINKKKFKDKGRGIATELELNFDICPLCNKPIFNFDSKSLEPKKGSKSEILKEEVLRKIYLKKSSRAENLYVVSGSNQQTETDNRTEANEMSREKSTVPPLRNRENTYPEKGNANTGQPSKIVRKRKSVSEEIRTSGNKENEHLTQHSGPKKYAPKRQVIGDTPHTKDNAQTVSNYQKYEQLYLNKRGTDKEENVNSNGKKILYRRKSTSNITNESPSNKRSKVDEHTDGKQEEPRQEYLQPQKISYRRKSESAKDSRNSETIRIELGKSKDRSKYLESASSSNEEKSSQVHIAVGKGTSVHRIARPKEKGSTHKISKAHKEYASMSPVSKLQEKDTSESKTCSNVERSDSTRSIENEKYDKCHGTTCIDKSGKHIKIWCSASRDRMFQYKPVVEDKNATTNEEYLHSHEIKTHEKSATISSSSSTTSSISPSRFKRTTSSHKRSKGDKSSPSSSKKSKSQISAPSQNPTKENKGMQPKNTLISQLSPKSNKAPENLVTSNNSEFLKRDTLSHLKNVRNKKSIVEKHENLVPKQSLQKKKSDSSIDSKQKVNASNKSNMHEEKSPTSKIQIGSKEHINSGSMSKNPKSDKPSEKREKLRKGQHCQCPKTLTDQYKVLVEQFANSSRNQLSDKEISPTDEIRLSPNTSPVPVFENLIVKTASAPESKNKSKQNRISHEKKNEKLSVPKKIVPRRRSEGAPSKSDNSSVKHPPNDLETREALKIPEAPISVPYQSDPFTRNGQRRNSEPSLPTYNIVDYSNYGTSSESPDQLDALVNNLSPETLLEKMFTDEKETEESRRALIKILATSTDESGDESDGTPNCNIMPRSDIKNQDMHQIYSCYEIIVIDSDSDECVDLLTDPETELEQQNVHPDPDMTKMEHYKKRLIHQHEKPSVLSSFYPTTEEEDDHTTSSPSISPISSTSSIQSTQNSLQEKKKEETAYSKVAKKKAVSRKQFRHQNLELFKLGTSIPTSLCKTKEPYNICTEKNLQMCYQSQNGTKEKNASITQAIINSIEGNKKREPILWRSLSLNEDTSENPKDSNINLNVENKNTANGRHVLPAIVSETPERRKNKISPTVERENNNGCVNVIQRAEPISINKRKHIAHRRKTVIGIENSTTEININVPELNAQEGDTESSKTELVSQCSPINLSVKRTAPQNGTQPTQVNGDPRLKSTSKYGNNQKPSGSRQGNGSQTIALVQNTNQNAEFAASDAPNNVCGIRFPEMQQQMIRMGNSFATSLNNSALRQEALQQLAVAHPLNYEELIRTIIQLVKSSMDPNFSVEILLILNKWYCELKAFSRQSYVSKGLKSSITRTLNEVIQYVTIKLFGLPYNAQLKSYVEEMMLLSLLEHKELLMNLLPLLSRNCHNQQWMFNFLKLLAHPAVKLTEENPPDRRINENQMRSILSVPASQMCRLGPAPGEHQFAHPSQLQVQRFFPPPEQYFMSRLSLPPPYEGYHYKENTLPNSVGRNYAPPNMDQYQQAVQNLYLESVEAQRSNPQSQGLYPTTPQHYQRPEHFNVPPPTKHVRPNRLHLADNRCVPPKFEPTAQQARPNVDKHNANDRLEIIPIRPRNTSDNLVAPNNVPNNTFEPPQIANHGNIKSQSRGVIQVISENASQVSDARDPSREVRHGHLETATSSNKVSERSVEPDVEELLHTNVIFNESHPHVDIATPKAIENNENTINVNDTTVQPVVVCNSDNTNKPIPSTVIVQDNSMEITRGNSNGNIARVEVIVDKHGDASKEIVVERIRYIRNCNDDTSSSTLTITKDNLTDEVDLNLNLIKVVPQRANPGDEDQPKEPDSTEEYMLYYGMLQIPATNVEHNEKVITIDDDEEVSIEDGIEMPKPKEAPPKLIKLAPLKRKDNKPDKAQQGKKLKRDAAPNKKKEEIVIIDVENNESTKIPEKKEASEKNSDCNQNYITNNNEQNTTNTTTISEASTQAEASGNAVSPIPSNTGAIEEVDSPIRAPIIEDISSDEEPTEPFSLYNTYDNKINGDPRKILETTEVSHCTLIEGNVKLMEEAVRHELRDKPLVYTKPVTPPKVGARHTTEPEKNARQQGRLASIAQFEEDGTSLTCRLKVRDTSELGYPPPKCRDGGGPYFIEETRYPPRTPPVNSSSPNRYAPFKSNGAVPVSPVAPVRQSVPSSPVSPLVPDNSKANWKNWISNERRKGFFNLARSLSTDSGRRSIESTSSAGEHFPVGTDYYEITIDSKVCTIKKSLYERIPKGKLCYIRETNSFIRYFDDKQMELFIHNLNINEGSLVASDLLKQIKGRAVDGFADIDVSLGHHESSGRSEIITLPKDIRFSAEDYLSDAELYVVEVEKVERYVPKDFSGFYKFVTGYQIVNFHPPISFQTFLTMHNTNGIRRLFKNYINTLIEGRNIL